MSERYEAYREAWNERYAICIAQPDVSEREARKLADDAARRVWQEWNDD